MNIKHSKTRFKTAVGLALLVVCSLLPLARLSAQPLALLQDEPGGPVYLAGDILIQFKPGATDAELLDVVKRGALIRLVKHIQTDAMKAAKQPGVSHMWTGLPVRQAIEALKNHPAVEFAEPNWVYTHQDTSNDPYFVNGNLWGMYGDLSSPANQFGSQAAEAWAAGYTGSGSVVVGVIDEGIQFTHPDLAANIWTNPYETAGDSIDNDGNGYVDDIHGWNFVGNNNVIYIAGADSHGTHVSGTIGAVANNGIGVVGVNWNVTIISGKFLGPNGGTTADAIEAVDYFTGLKIKHPEMNLVALNNSWGGGGFSQALLDAIVRAANKNILFMAAAGNAGVNNDTTLFYPARYDTTAGAGYNSVIAVAAIQSDGALASFSNYGKNTVHLGAPGVGIWSTVPTDSYASYSGTSMATPHVTGAAALYASTHPGATAPQIRDAILSSVAATASLAGKTITGGRLDLSTVIAPSAPPTTPPAAPTGLRAIAGNSQVSLAWVGSPGASSYTVKRRIAGGTYDQSASGVTSTSYVNSTAINGTTYYYVVSAVNTIGESVNSTEVSATPQLPPTPPAAPTGLSATAGSRSQINLTWTDKSVNEDGFKIERAGNNKVFSQIAITGAGQNFFSDSGLSRNTTYYYRVRAFNAAGNSGYSNTASARTLR